MKAKSWTPITTGWPSIRPCAEASWRQRLAAVANIPLLLFFIGLIVSLNGATYAEVRQTLANPFVALLTVFVLGSALFHMKLGMQSIIEDYIHGEGLKIALVMLNIFFPIVIGATCVFALLKISFGV